MNILIFVFLFLLKSGSCFGDFQNDQNLFNVSSNEQILPSFAPILSVQESGTEKQLDLIRQVDHSSFIIKVLNLLIFILFLVVLLIGVFALRYYIRAKRDLIKKNEQIGFYNKKLVEKNAQLQKEIKRRMDESVFEMSQRELVLGSLKESDQKFSAAFYHHPEMILIFDLNSEIVLDVNESFLYYFNIEVVDIIEKKISDLALGSSGNCLVNVKQELKQRGIVKDYLVQLSLVEAKQVSLSMSASVINFGQRECCCLSIRDISALYQENLQLNRFLTRYEKAAPNSGEFLWSVNLDMEFEFVSESVFFLLGYSPTEIIGMSYLDFLSSNSQKIIQEQIKSILSHLNEGIETQKTISEELEYVHKDGRKLSFLCFGKVVFDEGYLLRIEGVSKNVSEVNELKSEVFGNQHYYGSILNSLNDIVFIFDEKLNLSFISDSIQRFIGYEVEEVMKMSISDYLTEKSIQKLNSLPSYIQFNSVKGERGILDEVNYEMDFISKDGDLKTTYVRTRLLLDEKYRLLGYVSIMRDITQEKKLQNKNRKSEMYFKKLFDDSPVMMLITDELNMILDVNKAFIETVEFSLNELKQMHFDALLKLDESYVGESVEKDIRAKLKKIDGEILNVLIRPTDFTDPDHKRMNLFVIRDVTDHIQTENLRAIRENQYIAIAETSPNMLIRFDKTMSCTYANKALEKQLKVKKENIIGKNPNLFISDQVAAQSLYQSCLSALIDEKEIAKDIKMNFEENVRVYNLRVIPEVDAEGLVNSVICVIANVTDYVTAIEDLEKNIQQTAFLNKIIAVCNKATNNEDLLKNLHFIFQSYQIDVGFMSVLWDENDDFQYPIYSSLVKQEQVGFQEFLLKPHRFSEMRKNFLTALNTDEFPFSSYNIVLNDKKRRFDILPLLSKNQVLGFVAFIDLSDEKLKWLMMGAERLVVREIGSAVHRILAEQKHFESNESYRLLVEATDDMVWKVCKNLNIVFVSSKSKQLLGYLPDELINVSFLSLIYEVYQDHFQQFVELNTKKPEMFSFYDVPMIHKKGHIVAVEMQGYPVFDENQQLVAYSGVLRDIALPKLNEELRRSKEVAEGISKMKQEFLDNISHEIRTPLNAIIGVAEILSKKKMEEDQQQQFIEAIKKNGNTLLSLVNNVLDLSKIDSGKLKLNNKRINVDVFLNDLFVAFMSLANSKGLKLDFAIDHNLPKFIEIDELRFKQIFLNLLSNAVKFAEKGYIRLEIIASEVLSGKCNLIIKFKDSGPGIPPEEIDLIWETFMQSKNNNQFKRGGSGLGLDITKKIVELMKGSITVKSELQKETCFTVSLPDVKIAQAKQKNSTFDFETCILLAFSEKDSLLLSNIVLQSQLASDCLVFSSVDEIGLIPTKALMLVNEELFYNNNNNRFFQNFSGKIIVFVSQFSSYKTSSLGHVRCYSKSRFAIFDAVRRLKDIKPVEIFLQKELPVYSNSISEIRDFVYDEFFESYADPLWKKAYSSNAINDLAEFSNMLLEFAEKKKIVILKDYAQKIALATKMFDIEKIPELLKRYPDIKKEVLKLF